MYKLLLFDLDGTLLSVDRKIPRESHSVLKNLMARGVRVGLATGRSRRSVQPYIDDLQPNGPMILFNGAQVWDSVSDRLIHSTPLPFEIAHCLLTLVREFDDIHVNLYVDRDVLISKKTARSLESEVKDGVPHSVVGDLANWLAHRKTDPVKIMLISEPEILSRLKSEFVRRTPAPCSLIHSEWNYLEFMRDGINKGQALPVVEKEFGIDRSHIVSFGDNLNDLDLIRLSGFGVAMGNAHQDLKTLARRTIGPHDDNRSISIFLNEIFG